jgi:uncharacterized membrane protein
MEWAFLIILALAILLAGVIAFIMVILLKSRVALLEVQVRLLEQKAAAAPQPLRPAQTSMPPAASAPPATAKTDVASETNPEPLPDAIAAKAMSSDNDKITASTESIKPEPLVTAAASTPAPAQTSFEEKLGARWAVWVGGIALGLGGILLARYSIEQGYFGPGFRTLAGIVLAAALIAGGEWLRRRESGFSLPGLESAHVPGVLTAAGTATAFATVYAAYALYGFIGPALAFVLLGLISVATMVAAALHGPALAALGLLGALVAPLMVSSNSPRAWPVVIYLAFVTASAYGVARLRLWRWLALAAAVGALLWGVMLIDGFGAKAATALMAYVLIQTFLAGVFMVADPHRGTSDSDAQIDRFATNVLAGMAFLAILTIDRLNAGMPLAIFAGVMIALNAGLAWTFAPAAIAAVLAAGIAAGTLWLWPVAGLVANEPVSVLPGPLVAPPQPEALTLYLIFGVLAGLGLIAVGFVRLVRGFSLRPPMAAAYAVTATAGPLIMLALAYWRVTAFTPSVPFAIGAAVLAAIFVFAAARLRAMDDGSYPALRIALGAAAAACVAALALGMAFVLDKGMLTVAVALAALGAAYVAHKLDVPGLRYVVGAVGVVVATRILLNPTIAGPDVGSTPIFNWLLWGYGVPTLAFAVAAVLLGRTKIDWVTRLCESLAILFGALLFVFQIRHALHDGNPFARASGHVEMGLLATVGLGFSVLMIKLDGIRADRLYKIAGLAFGVLTLLVVAGGLLIFENPLFNRQPIAGGAIINSLLLAYLLPALMAGLVAWIALGVRPRWYVGMAGALGLILSLLYAMIEVRFLFQGPVVSMWRSTSQPEMWTYSAVLLLIGIAFLAFGLWRNQRLARLMSAPYIVLAVLKVFLIDMSNLDGALRALSFIGLGLTLVGIGLAYQKLLARGRTQASPSEPPLDAMSS